MNKVLYLKELKRNRKNSLIWGAIVLGFTFMILSIYPSFAEMGEQMAQLMSKLPQEMARAFGIDDATWSSIIGFYATYYGIYITLLMGIFTASTGATILGKEERDGTAEFLLTRPLSRRTVVNSKYAALFTLLLAIYVVQTLCAIGGIVLFGTTVDWAVFQAMHVHGFVLVVFFTGISVLLASFVSPKINFMGPVVGLIFGSYFLDAISKASDTVEFLGYLSPYHYLQLQAEKGVLEANWGASAILIGVAVLAMWAAKVRYVQRDIAG